jgi:hypothetical protein
MLSTGNNRVNTLDLWHYADIAYGTSSSYHEETWKQRRIFQHSWYRLHYLNAEVVNFLPAISSLGNKSAIIVCTTTYGYLGTAHYNEHAGKNAPNLSLSIYVILTYCWCQYFPFLLRWSSHCKSCLLFHGSTASLKTYSCRCESWSRAL